MIRDADMYRRASREVSRLEGLAKSGTATEHDRERLANGRADVLAWGWANDGTPAAEVIPAEPARALDPRALRFLAWWERNQRSAAWSASDWIAAFVWWSDPMALDGFDRMDLCNEVADALEMRASLRGAA